MTVNPPPIEDIQFVEKIPEKAGTFAESRWVPVLKHVDAHRGNWALVVRADSPKDATAAASQIRSASKSKGYFQIAIRGANVYLRALPDPV